MNQPSRSHVEMISGQHFAGSDIEHNRGAALSGHDARQRCLQVRMARGFGGSRKRKCGDDGKQDEPAAHASILMRIARASGE